MLMIILHIKHCMNPRYFLVQRFFKNIINYTTITPTLSQVYEEFSLKGTVAGISIDPTFQNHIIEINLIKNVKITSFFHLEKCYNAPVTFGKKTKLKKSVFRKKNWLCNAYLFRQCVPYRTLST